MHASLFARKLVSHACQAVDLVVVLRNERGAFLGVLIQQRLLSRGTAHLPFAAASIHNFLTQTAKFSQPVIQRCQLLGSSSHTNQRFLSCRSAFFGSGCCLLLALCLGVICSPQVSLFLHQRIALFCNRFERVERRAFLGRTSFLDVRVERVQVKLVLFDSGKKVTRCTKNGSFCALNAFFPRRLGNCQVRAKTANNARKLILQHRQRRFDVAQCPL